MGLLLLVRHAESVPPGPGFEDEFSRPLSEEGFRQAIDLASRLEQWRPTKLCSSPYLRAIQTLRPFAERSGLEIVIDSEFREHRMCSSPISHWREVLAGQWADFAHVYEDGESMEASQARGLTVVRRWLPAEGVVALAGHGTTISLVLNSIDPTFRFEEHLAMPNPAVYGITGSVDRLELAQLDSATH